VSSYTGDSFLALAGPYALEVESGSHKLEGDAAQMVVGGGGVGWDVIAMMAEEEQRQVQRQRRYRANVGSQSCWDDT